MVRLVQAFALSMLFGQAWSVPSTEDVCLHEGSQVDAPVSGQALLQSRAKLDRDKVLIKHHQEPQCLSNPVLLDFSVPLTANNLGGHGPEDGDPVIRWSGIATVRGSLVDLEISAGENYDPQKPELNGNSDGGPLGNINMNLGSTADITFTFKDQATGEPAVLDEFYISFFDFDKEQQGGSTESLYSGDHDSYLVGVDNELTITEEADGRTHFRGTTAGTGRDNPTDPNALGVVEGVDQRKRALMLAFQDKSTFTVTYEIADGVAGRNFLFAGCAPISDACNCGCPAPATVAHLDFSVPVTANNLGGHGPEEGDPVIRFSGITSVGGSPVDLEISASESYVPIKTEKNGQENGLGRINQEQGTSADFTYTFKDQATGEPVVLDFYMSFYDFDHEQAGGAVENVYIGDYTTVFLEPDTDLESTEEADGRLHLQATQPGRACDNPTNPHELEVACDVDQRKRAVMFYFQGKSTITLTYEISPGQNNRNFLFAGCTTISGACPCGAV